MPLQTSSHAMQIKKYYCAVNYNGSTVKCTACNDLYEDKSKGYISGTGQIEWINDFDKKYCQPSLKMRDV